MWILQYLRIVLVQCLLAFLTLVYNRTIDENMLYFEVALVLKSSSVQSRNGVLPVLTAGYIFVFCLMCECTIDKLLYYLMLTFVLYSF